MVWVTGGGVAVASTVVPTVVWLDQVSDDPVPPSVFPRVIRQQQLITRGGFRTGRVMGEVGPCRHTVRRPYRILHRPLTPHGTALREVTSGSGYGGDHRIGSCYGLSRARYRASVAGEDGTCGSAIYF